jgi:2-methylcitrate dehydratase PrpD
VDRATTATITLAATLSRRIAQGARQLSIERLPLEAVEKVKISLLDMLSCALEARDLPWSSQAIEIASRTSGGTAPIIGTPHRV